MKTSTRLFRGSDAALLLVAGLLPGCQVCPCQLGGSVAPSGQGGGGATAASAAAEGGGAVEHVPYEWKNVTILGGGFVSGVVFSPVEIGLIYARTDVGGAYRWNGADQTWVPLNDDLPRDSSLMGIESIAADPVDANRVYAAAGTYVKPWAGNGAILKSDDRGNTWTRIDLPIQMGGNENGRSNGERLAVDPNQPSILYFGSRAKGLWKSADSGATWHSTDFPAKQDPDNIGIVFVLFDKQSGTKGKPTPVVYAGVARADGSVYRSTDGGSSWQLMPKQPLGMMPSHAAFDARRTLYISYGSGPGPNDVIDGAVWKYDSESNAFTNITPAAPDRANDKFGYGGLSVDATHPGVVMVSTINRWTKGDEIFRPPTGERPGRRSAPKP